MTIIFGCVMGLGFASFCCLRAANSKIKWPRKAKVSVNIAEGSSNWCGNFQITGPKVGVRVRVSVALL